jgi:hypothetical protein
MRWRRMASKQGRGISMRPPSILMFERLFLASLAVSAASIIIGFDATVDQLANEPGTAALGIGGGLLAGIVAFGFAISLLLWFLIAHKASNIAKWILIVLAALGLVSLPAMLTGRWDTVTLLGLGSYALEIAALVYLFRNDAAAWFKGEWHANPTTFD